MDLESVKRYLETGGYEDDRNASTTEEMPPRFFERFIMQGLHLDLIEPGRVVCSMKVPPRLLHLRPLTLQQTNLCLVQVQESRTGQSGGEGPVMETTELTWNNELAEEFLRDGQQWRMLTWRDLLTWQLLDFVMGAVTSATQRSVWGEPKTDLGLFGILPSSNKGCVKWYQRENMDLESVKRYLETGGYEDDKNASPIGEMPLRFFEKFIRQGLHIDVIEPGRVVCSMKVPPRLLNGVNILHGGATASLADLVGSAAMFTVGAPVTGVSVEINVSYLDAAFAGEEIEIESRIVRVGKTVGIVSVEFKKKRTGKIIAQGRYTKYLAVSSKM